MWTPHCVTKYNLEEKKKKKPSFSNQTLIYVFLVLKKNVLYLNMMWNTLFCIRNTLNTVFLAHFLKTVFWLFWKQKHQSLLIWDMRAFLIWISHYASGAAWYIWGLKAKINYLVLDTKLLLINMNYVKFFLFLEIL